MEHADEKRWTSSAAVAASLGAALVFEALAVLATQDEPVRAIGPWQDDPYDAVVSLGQFMVPIPALVIVLRLLAWRMPGGPDRGQRTMRAAAVMIALVGIALVAEWAAVMSGAHRSSWDGWTGALSGGLATASILTVVAAATLVRCRRARGSSRRWRHDWLGDVVMLCKRTPVLRNWAGPETAAWVRRRAMTVFVALSVLAAVGITGAQAIGERWTNPLLTAWMLIVETTSYLTFCLIGNAIAGFVARPARSRRQRVTETSVITGSVAIQVATAFRDALWPGAAPLTSVPALVALTLGAGLLTSLVTAGLRATWPQPTGSANGSG
ncbi:hypothetical protein ACFOY4_10070 [Actinomadura syzygii]|uniref:Uncharacterized protein n=1 Tax=Actinomadura syzygii TaxID=1427538 RepID=A0A5D0UDH1_9ACTN|nr:hypothetical protein [Actinomadura syzygii]TYC15840.1 hypothetical protein FXF65_10890 [Actinomadura syzygii]